LITIYKRFDEGRVDYEGAIELDKLTKFIDEHRVALVAEFNDKTAERIF